MRRYILYIAVALLAFGVGSFIVCKFYWETQHNSSKIELPVEYKTEVVNNFLEDKKTKQPEFIKFQLKDLPCEDNTLQLVWRELTNEFAEINTERAEEIQSCEDFLEVCDFFYTDAELDLNNDGVKEVFIRGIKNPFSRCGNNCYTYWIFQKTKENNYRKLFEAEGYLPVVKNRKTAGYKDVLFEVFMREFESGNILYQYNGTEYVPKRCWSESRLYKGKGGDLVLGKNYRNENLKCEESGYITNYRNRIDSQ